MGRRVTARVVFLLTPEEKVVLKRLADQEGRTKANLLRRWINEHRYQLINSEPPVIGGPQGEG